MTAMEKALFGAVLVQILLTFVLYGLLVSRRFAAARDPETDRKRLAYDQTAWPIKARQASNAVVSQFEAPTLFFVGALFAFHFGRADIILAVLGWLFVLFRIAHAAIHVGPNVVMQRFAVFLASFAALAAFWIWLALRVFIVG
ncbi:MAG: MAPEG family protein [Amphiplicatus sp.]